MSDYRATPEQWAQTEGKSPNSITGLRWSMACCILELRARVEGLETTQKPHQDKLDRLIALDREDSLVKRVQHAIYVEYARSKSAGQPEARAAIREVATWLEEEFGPQIDWITTELREEACSE